MNKSTLEQDLKGARLVSIDALCNYTGLASVKARQFAKEAGAVKHIGARCLYDLRKIDEAIDALEG